MKINQRFYIDGKLNKTAKGLTPERARKYLDNIEKEWSKNGMFPLTPSGEFDLNQAHSVTRVSIDELIIVNTKGNTLRFINVEVK